MRAAAIGLAASLLLIPCSGSLRAQETEVLFDLLHEALRENGSSGAAMQVEATRAVTQPSGSRAVCAAPPTATRSRTSQAC